MYPSFLRWLCIFLLAADLIAAEPETDSTTLWRIEAADCNYLLQAHRRHAQAERGDPAEQLTIRAGAGTYVYAGYSLAPSQLIDDLQVGVWVRSERRGIQLLGRVVLPDTHDPQTGRRATVLVPGEIYDSAGGWQRLTLRDLPAQVERQARVVRARLRQVVDTRQAYLESIVMNVYGGPGTTDVWLGQVEHRGIVPPKELPRSNVVPAAFDRTESSQAAPPQRQAERLIVDGKPFFPRVIEFRGEPLELLRDLGFNTLAFGDPPTVQQQRQAEDLGLWLLAPPPAQESAEAASRRILGWYCGDRFPASKLAPSQLAQLRQRDPLRRPLVAAVQRDQWRASRELDVLLRVREPLGSSFELSHFGSWLDQQTHLVRPGTPFWSSVQTQLPRAATEQAAALARSSVRMPRIVQAEQIRQLALAAVAAGARGLWFKSDTSLAADDTETELRRIMLELVNYELALIEPWGMGGQRLGEVPCDNAELRVVALATERSRLLIPTYQQRRAQFVCRPTQGDNSLVIAGVADSTDVFQLSHVGLTPLERQRISGGLRIAVEPDAADQLLLLTEDPLIVTHINRTVVGSKRRVVQLQQDLAERLLADFESQASRKLLESSARVANWETARQALQTSRDLSRASDFSSAYRFARQAHRELSRLQADVWQAAAPENVSPLQHPASISFPLVVAANFSPQHSLPPPSTAPNRLRGGDCENLDLMIQAGWRQQQSAPADINTYISLSPHEPHGGQTCLRILASPRSPDASQSVIEFAPVWVNSAPVTVAPGQTVVVSGWVRIDQPIRGTLDGCLITDSLGGPPLGLRWQRTHGWEPFQMVRAVTRHDHLTVTIRLEGLGDVWVDDLSISVHDREPEP